MRTIKNSDLHIPFNQQALSKKINENLNNFQNINVFLKGGRFSSKSWWAAIQIIQLLYANPGMSAMIIGMTIVSHGERTIPLFEKILMHMELRNEWRWEKKSTKPALIREVNGYRQEIKFVSLPDLETAGYEPQVNEITGKSGYYGIIWADEMSKKTDNSPDAKFDYINRLFDAVATAKGTFVRHMENNAISNANMFVIYSLNPWGKQNPIIKKYHDFMGPDDIEKLKTKGYNIGYEYDDDTLNIYATTNYLVNTKLSKRARDEVKRMLKEPRRLTRVYGATGEDLNSTFGAELNIMARLAKAGNIPKDNDFIPLTFGMDIGTTSPSAFYMIGTDKRTLIYAGGNVYPTRLIGKSEYVIFPKKDDRTIKERYFDFLWFVQRLSLRFPVLKKGIVLYIDGSAIDTIELLKAYVSEIQNSDPSFDLPEWLEIVPQRDKWKASERVEARKDRFAEMVGSYALIMDPYECPYFYSETYKIVSAASEKLFDHNWDGGMYGIMPLQEALYQGLRIKAMRNKPNILQELAD